MREATRFICPFQCGKFLKLKNFYLFNISQKLPKCLPFFRITKRYPFDWRTPIGYFVAIFIDYIIMGYAYFTVACTVTLGIGAYCFVISATEEVQRILHSIHQKAHSNQSSALNILLPKYIHAHRIVKQLSIQYI